MQSLVHSIPSDLIKSFPAATILWNYRRSDPPWTLSLRRKYVSLWRESAPESKLIKAPQRVGSWILYFIYSPDGKLTNAHWFTLERLRREDVRVMVVCACAKGSPIMEVLETFCDSLIWKEIKGWDFCGFSQGLWTLARTVPGSNVLVLNDSVYGPFRPLLPFMEFAPWRITGFTGNNQIENHIQSYAFIIRTIDEEIMNHMGEVFDRARSFSKQRDVVLCQETMLARLCAERFSAGSYWFTKSVEASDLCLGWPEELLDAGFPFFKRSLTGKFANVFNELPRMNRILAERGHPTVCHDTSV